MVLFFSTDAINIDDTIYFSPAAPALADGGASGARSLSDSLALLTSGLIMLISASFLRRLSG